MKFENFFEIKKKYGKNSKNFLSKFQNSFENILEKKLFLENDSKNNYKNLGNFQEIKQFFKILSYKENFRKYLFYEK